MKTNRLFGMAAWMLLVSSMCGCGDDPPADPSNPAPPPYEPCRMALNVGAGACGTGQYDAERLLPGPKSPMYDADLAAKMRRYDRLFHALNAYSTGVNTEFSVTDPNDRLLVDAFAQQDNAWSFEAQAGKKPEDIVGGWSKVAGAYGGVGVAADAFRYATLREQGADCKEVDIARDHLKRDLDV